MDKGKIEFPFKCPVCGKSEFDDFDWLLEEDKDIESYSIDSTTGKLKLSDAIDTCGVFCEYCGWTYDLKQLLDYDSIGDRNEKSVNELKQIYLTKIKENPNYNFSKEISLPKPHKCPICGKYEFKNICSYDICPICEWIDDGTENIPFDDYSEVNVISIKEAKEEFTKRTP